MDVVAQARDAAAALPPGTRALAAASAVLALLGWVATGADGRAALWPHLAASGYVLPPSMNVWALLTAGLFEYSVLQLLVTLPLLVLAARYLEGVWGTLELLRFVAIVNAAAALLVIVFQIVGYALTFDPLVLYGTYVSGHVPLLLAFLVAFKQLVPEHTVTLAEPLRLRAKDAPLAGVAFAVVFYLLTGRVFLAIFAVAGFFAGWVYLRFYQYRDGIRGDRSETFSFAMFFPEPLQPLAKAAATMVFRMLVVVRLCDRVEPRTQEEIEMEEAIFVRKDAPSVLGTETSDAERRRQKALHALETRLNAPPLPAASSPSSAAATTPSAAPQRPGTPFALAPSAPVAAAIRPPTGPPASYTAVTLVPASDAPASPDHASTDAAA